MERSAGAGALPVTLAAGDLEAVFLPARGMVGSSLRHRGVELLRRVDDLEALAAKGSSAGIPLLHPWANRLASCRYEAAGREVVLDMASPLLHADERGLPIHGVPWPLLAWEVLRASADAVHARLEWTRADLLALFPFPHCLDMTASLSPGALTIETTLIAGEAGPVPVSFGFHPYFGLPDLPRAQWRLILPAMQRLLLDPRGIPTGERSAFPAFDGELGDSTFDDGFTVVEQPASFSLAGGGRRITVEFLAGYPYAQVFAPPGKDLVALEPMTAPTNALISGAGLASVEAGESYRAVFQVRTE